MQKVAYCGYNSTDSCCSYINLVDFFNESFFIYCMSLENFQDYKLLFYSNFYQLLLFRWGWGMCVAWNSTHCYLKAMSSIFNMYTFISFSIFAFLLDIIS